MFERFTGEARQVIVLAREEAMSLRHDHIGTEHILLGLLRSEEGTVRRILDSLGVSSGRVRAEIMRLVGEGDHSGAAEMPFTPRAKASLELALRESQAARAPQIEPCHLLLGVAGEGEGMAARILREADADTERIRTELGRAG